jgi:uncharacterized protein with PIN domain
MSRAAASLRFVVDTSALVAIVNDEPEAERFHGLLLDHEPVISATLIETLRVISAASFGANAPASWCEEALEQLCPSAAE